MSNLVMNASGRLINPFQLNPETDFEIEVVAQTLSRICRFWGQTTEFYSVAQHCITMAQMFKAKGDLVLARWALLHEYFEGVTGMDIPSPIKHSPHMTDYVKAEDRCLEQVADFYGLPKPLPKEVKEADRRMMVTEALRFMSSENYDWVQNCQATPYHIGVIGTPMGHEEAKKAFLDLYWELIKVVQS